MTSLNKRLAGSREKLNRGKSKKIAAEEEEKSEITA